MDKWIMCIVALILGMLMFHMLKNVCGCKNIVEGQFTDAMQKWRNQRGHEYLLPSDSDVMHCESHSDCKSGCCDPNLNEFTGARQCVDFPNSVCQDNEFIDMVAKPDTWSWYVKYRWPETWYAKIAEASAEKKK